MSSLTPASRCCWAKCRPRRQSKWGSARPAAPGRTTRRAMRWGLGAAKRRPVRCSRRRVGAEAQRRGARGALLLSRRHARTACFPPVSCRPCRPCRPSAPSTWRAIGCARPMAPWDAWWPRLDGAGCCNRGTGSRANRTSPSIWCLQRSIPARRCCARCPPRCAALACASGGTVRRMRAHGTEECCSHPRRGTGVCAGGSRWSTVPMAIRRRSSSACGPTAQRSSAGRTARCLRSEPTSNCRTDSHAMRCARLPRPNAPRPRRRG
mmetsp:Transcript_28776/g.91854  ORF Transcript_28776/g.91854 Transcript_28776/m.91854 type:complete len:265 (-) Transcript_28776:808-1602(-)